jgi:two-component system cell cycle sensor histidine kinase/response regulator CckA
MSSIIIIEDENIVAMDLAATLRRLGYEVLGTASRGEDAVDLAARTSPDLILMDIMLSGAMDGVQAAERIRAAHDIPIVFLTAYTDDQTIERASRSEPYGFIVKPFHDRDIKSAVEVALHKHAAEKARARNESMLARAFQSIGEGAIASDANGQVTFVNAVAAQLCATSPAEAVGRPLADLLRLVSVDTRAPVANPVAAAIAARVPALLPDRTSLITRAGTELPIDGCAAPIVDAEGRDAGGVLIFRDATVTRRLQSKLLLADRMAAVGVLAAGIGHEVNNPLAYVMANLEFALDEVGRGNIDAERLAEALREARHGIHRVTAIAKQLRAWSRAEIERPEDLSLHPLLDIAISMAWAEMRHRARLIKEYGPVPEVHADETRLAQAFIILLVNAAHAIAEGNLAGNTVRIVTRTENGRAIVEIHDTGSRIPPEHLSEVFEPFSTAASAGIGLAIAHGAIGTAGGTLEAAADPAGGNVFTVSLPGVVVEPIEPPRRPRVLIVDDEALVCGAVKRTLSDENDVTALSSAREALSRFSAGERWDVVFMDLLMPEMSGMDLYDAVDRIAPDQTERVIFLTGGAFSKRATDFLASGKRYIEKPFDTSELRLMVQKALT